tara:strand:- start:26 stop:619 length:594 start_codon:yes stop_codon:yes gene_type:complete
MIVRLFNMLGVKPHERRSVILLLIAFFVIGNVGWMFFEIPDLTEDMNELKTKSVENELLPQLQKNRAILQKEVDDLRGEEQMVRDGSQAEKLMGKVAKEAEPAKLSIPDTRVTRGTTSKDSEFDELKLNIQRCNANTVQLVDFLKRVADNHPMVRVSDVTIQPNRDKKDLQVTLVFVASFPKENKKPVSKKPAKKGN